MMHSMVGEIQYVNFDTAADDTSSNNHISWPRRDTQIESHPVSKWMAAILIMHIMLS